MITYKFRAECQEDAQNFQNISKGLAQNFDFQKGTIIDIIVTFESNLNLSDIIGLLRNIEDGDVMVQTVRPIHEYTGERNYEL